MDAAWPHAARAAAKVARCLGRARAAPVVLGKSHRLCLLLPDIPIVARIAPATAATFAVATRELRVTRALAARGAPVIAPCAAMPETPFVAEGLAITLWPYVVHMPIDADDDAGRVAAARALRRVHDAFADDPGPLPPYTDKIEECVASLRRPGALAALAADDRRFLLATYERLRDALARRPVRLSPIHGDAHLGNVLATPNGALWTDFEAACLGPREWDAAGVPHPRAFQPLDAAISRIMARLRALCVIVWCAALAADPDKRAAAAYHLARLRADDALPAGRRSRG